MKIQDVMTKNVTYVSASTTLRDAARKLREIDAGFLPIGEGGDASLTGVVTDRDIAIRGVAEGKNPSEATVDEIKSEKVLYCYETDSTDDAARSMANAKVYRLVVLDDDRSKRMTGVVTLSDIAKADQEQRAGEVTTQITS